MQRIGPEIGGMGYSQVVKGLSSDDLNHEVLWGDTTIRELTSP
jgi:hypothetical protein